MATCRLLVAFLGFIILSGSEAQTCTKDGVNYKLGESVSDSLRLCHCTGEGMRCMYLPGRKRMTAQTCTKDGVNYKLGESVSDSLRLCHCTGEEAQRKCVHNGVPMKTGESFTESDKWCSCSEQGQLECINKGGLVHGKRQHIQLTMAKECKHNGLTLKPGESFKDGSRHCMCIEDQGQTRLNCLTVHSESTGKREVEKRLFLVHEDSTCSHGGAEYEEGESYREGCDVYTCRGGHWRGSWYHGCHTIP